MSTMPEYMENCIKLYYSLLSNILIFYLYISLIVLTHLIVMVGFLLLASYCWNIHCNHRLETSITE